MSNYFTRMFRKKRGKAYMRLARQRAFNDMILRLGGHRGSKTFMVDTSGLKDDPPTLRVTERFSLLKLHYSHCIAFICNYHERKYMIVWDEKNSTLAYVIY